MAARWQLLDRRVEHAAVRSTLTGAEGWGVVLVGDAGVGKTTLARTVTESLRSTVRWVACTESSRSIPLGVFAQWVPTSVSRDPVTLITSTRESILTQDDTVIGVDDAHLLDQLSAMLLHQIAVDHAARIVATVRRGEKVPDAVTALWKDHYLMRVDLNPLTKAQSIALIESVLAGTLEGLSADVMWKSSGGNPLFLRHMVEGAVEAGTLTKVHGVWQLRGPAGVSSGLAVLLEERLRHAGKDVVNALKLLALCEPLDIDVLCELVGEDAVDAAEEAGLIRADQDGPQINARFSHPLYGDVLRRRVGTASARKLRGRLVKVLRDENLESAATRIRLAQLCIDSDEVIDTDLLIAAAKDAIFLSDLPLAERIARGAFEGGGGVQAAELLSRAMLWQGRPLPADQVLTDFDPDSLDELELVRWGVTHMSILFWSMGEVDRANQVLELLRTRVKRRGLQLVVEAVGSAMAVDVNNIAEGLAAAERVLSVPDAPFQAVEFAAFSAGLAMPVVGRGADFAQVAARCRAEQRATDGMIRVMVRYFDVVALTYIGELNLADQRVADYAQFSSAGQFLGWAIAKITAGLVATYQGKFTDAISSIEQALAALAAEAPLPWRLPARILLARAYAALGSIDQAERVLADAEEHTGRFVALHEPQRMITKSWVAAAKGSQRSAVELAHAAATLAHKSGQYAIEAEALHHAARFGDDTVADRLAELQEHVSGRVVALQSRHAAALAAADGDGLDRVSHEFENIGLILSAADSAAHASPIYERAGQRRKSTEAGARALALAAQCGGAVTPAIKFAAKPLPVTLREREIAGLIAEGMSNREIAERLTVSVRTVEGHIYRACVKLDVTDRDELAKAVWHR
jgi:DNA-binding CsgD family transcriptional regulator